jgi:phage-related minor tail protein
MSDNVETLGIRLTADGVAETTTGINLAGKEMEGLGKKADGATKPVKDATAAIERSGKTAKETAAAWRLMPAQITDVVTSLASGQPAWLVAIQQGGQIKDSFGGVGPMFKELAGSLTLGRLAVGGVAAAVGVLLLAHEQGQREAQAYGRALIMTGNAAGTSASQMTEMARAVSQTVGTQGKAADALAALAGTGEVARANLAGFAETAVRMERELGVPIEQTAQRFEELGRAPLEATLKLNRGVNYLTAATYDQIRALMAEGRTREAAAVAQKAYADAMKGNAQQVEQGLGSLQRGWRNVADAAKGAWDFMLGIGRPTTVKEQIDRIKAELDGFDAQRRAKGAGGLSEAPSAYERELSGRLAALRTQEEASLNSAEAVAQRKAELKARERATIDADNAISLAQAQAAFTSREQLAQRELAIAQASGSARESVVRAQMATLEDLRTRDGASLADYYQRRAELEQRALGVDIANIDAEIAAERKRTTARLALIDAQRAAEARRLPESAPEAAQQQARVIELAAQASAAQAEGETRVIGLKAQRGRLTAQQIEAELAGQRALMAASSDAADRFADDTERRRQALAQLNDQQRQANGQAAANLITDPYARAAAQARLEIDELRRYYTEQLSDLKARLPGLQASDPDQADRVRQQIDTAEAQKNQAIVLRTRQLTEALKPEWQKQLDAWRDHTRLMREGFDDFQNGWLASGRSAWQEYLRTGKFNVGSLVDFMRQQFGDAIFKQVLAEPFQKIGGQIAGFFFGGSGGGDAAKAVGQAGESAARTLNTSALSANSLALSNLGVMANSAAAALAGMAAAGGGGGSAALLGQILGAIAGGGSAFDSVDASGIGMTPGDGSVALPTAGGRATGGSTRRGSLYEVNERGPELLSVNNRTYLMMGGKDGFVTPNTGSAPSAARGGGSRINYAPVINIDARTDRAEVQRLVSESVRSGHAELLDAMERRQV